MIFFGEYGNNIESMLESLAIIFLSQYQSITLHKTTIKSLAVHLTARTIRFQICAQNDSNLNSPSINLPYRGQTGDKINSLSDISTGAASLSYET